MSGLRGPVATPVISVTAAPNGGYGSLLLVDDAYYQDVRLTCDATLGSGCDNAGLVFGYLDADNYWVKVYSNTDDTIDIYEINGGTWTQRSSRAYTITDDSPFTMAAEVRAGAADTYAGTVPSGQVGVWCSDSSDNDFDDFQVRDIVGPPLTRGVPHGGTDCAAIGRRRRLAPRQGFRWTAGTSAPPCDTASPRQGPASEVRTDDGDNNRTVLGCDVLPFNGAAAVYSPSQAVTRRRDVLPLRMLELTLGQNLR